MQKKPHITTIYQDHTLGRNCRTTSGKKPNKPCVFPFISDGITYSDCTTDQNNPGEPAWCATMVDEKGVQVVNEWGFCNGKCQPGKLMFFLQLLVYPL